MAAVYDMIEEFEDTFADLVFTMSTATPRDVGLDSRCSVTFYIPKEMDCLIVKGRTNSLEYYGGFEYIDQEFVTKIGQFTIYSAQCDRVADCLEYLMDENTEEQEEYQYGI
jgi:hypothetical protein